MTVELAGTPAARRTPSGLHDVLVIIPTYNERTNLPRVVELVLANPRCRVLVVDDESPDGTGEVADQLARESQGRTDVLHRSGARGLGSAYRAGISRALSAPVELICQMDADLSHDPCYLPALIEAAASADLVIGSRYTKGVSVVNWPLNRLILSTGANAYIRAVSGLPVRDCTSGFRCWRREALAAVHAQRVRSEGYAFLVEMLIAAHYSGLRIAEVPIIFVERRDGVSKVSAPVLMESLIAPVRAAARYRWRPTRRRPDSTAGPARQ
jgi:dolichol-phosphate mannosyltransferase